MCPHVLSPTVSAFLFLSFLGTLSFCSDFVLLDVLGFTDKGVFALAFVLGGRWGMLTNDASLLDIGVLAGSVLLRALAWCSGPASSTGCNHINCPDLSVHELI